MSRHNPPDHRDPHAFDGLRKRRQERGLPTGPIVRKCESGCGRDAPPGAAYCCDTCAGNPGHHSIGACPKPSR